MSRPEQPDGGFLSRWSRLKQETRRDEPLPEALPETALPASPVPDTAVESQTADPERPLPSLDDITPGANVSAFFGKHVPEALRNAALRKLWVTDPEIRDFIEMADYQWDFANPDSIPGWSSKLEGVDISSMIDRIFGQVPAAKEATEPQPDQPADGSSNPSESEPVAESSLGKNADIADIPDTSGNAVRLSDGPGESHVAVQNNLSESSPYVAHKRRHGGALPS